MKNFTITFCIFRANCVPLSLHRPLYSSTFALKTQILCPTIQTTHSACGPFRGHGRGGVLAQNERGVQGRTRGGVGVEQHLQLPHGCKIANKRVSQNRVFATKHAMHANKRFWSVFAQRLDNPFVTNDGGEN